MHVACSVLPLQCSFNPFVDDVDHNVDDDDEHKHDRECSDRFDVRWPRRPGLPGAFEAVRVRQELGSLERRVVLFGRNAHESTPCREGGHRLSSSIRCRRCYCRARAKGWGFESHTKTRNVPSRRPWNGRGMLGYSWPKKKKKQAEHGSQHTSRTMSPQYIVGHTHAQSHGHGHAVSVTRSHGHTPSRRS